MKKFSFITFLLLIYEIFRLLFFVKVSPVQDIPFQSASWYVSIPLLILPVIFIILVLYNPQKYKEFRSFISLSKIMSVIGISAYIGATIGEALNQVRFSQLYSINTIFFMMFFLLIDVIIGIIFIKYPKTEEEKDLCK
ncbi:MAG: hypothetical protein IIX47_01490 [Spirochaetaceae bacterium]|nr:hypothetical protein [Spirochaetaceae bacterium]MBQ1984240.1 hypothetical protein [Spirochaetaceae bacterium]